MDAVARLAKKAEVKGCRLHMRYNPEEPGEEWGVKFYPDIDEDGHYFAYHSDLDAACRKLLDEMTW